MADGNNRRGRWQGFDLGGGGNGDRRRWRFSLGYILLGLLVLMLLQTLLVQGNDIPYSQFLELVRQDRIVATPERPLAISETRITGQFRDEEGSVRPFEAVRPPLADDEQLVTLLTEHNIRFTGEQPSAFLGFILSWIVPIAILIALWAFLLRRMAGGGAAGALNLGKRGVKIYDRKDLKTTFADVAGVDEAVEELHEIVAFLENPKKYQRLGGRIPKGVLLLGPPGCGKTLLARAVAGEAKVPFFFMSGSEFVEMFVGLGAARVRELFQQAKDKAPCLVFLDELDTIGKTRGGAMGAGMGSHDEREQTLNQLLVEMDGFDASKGVIIMAATNRPDVLDPALLRPGRFDRQVVVDRPDLRGREAILQVHARGVALASNVDLQVIAARTPGFTGADLANVVNEAALLAARREKDSVGMAELEEAIDRVVAGLERKSRVMSEKEREIVAFHEMGHALVAVSLPNADPVHRVSIIPRGAAALGMTMQRPLEDRYIITEPEIEDRLAVLLGGRTGEEISFGRISTGAQNDLERATEIARAMVVEYGMSERIGPLSFGRDGFRGGDGRLLFPGDRPEMSEHTARIVDDEVSRIVGRAHEQARRLLLEKKDLLARLAKLLMVREVMEGKDLKGYVDGDQPIPDPEDERRKLQKEHEAREAKARQEEKDRKEPRPTRTRDELEPPPPPHSREPTEEVHPRPR
ncbi:MAG: ATP-dependent zinc metalloprotease FtsH [Actinomycetota bacterium]